MSAGLVIEVHRADENSMAAHVIVVDGKDLKSRYEQLTALVMRMGSWLSGPAAQLLPPDEWEDQFCQYQEHLEKLRRLGDELRPISLRDRYEPLTGDALVGEVMELFAA